jgi:hypothetical protein
LKLSQHIHHFLKFSFHGRCPTDWIEGSSIAG